jgi:TolB protein
MKKNILNKKSGCLLVYWLVIALLGSLPASLAQSKQFYSSARHGGNYMYNYYFPPSPSTTPWAPSWSPDGLSIAVAMSGAIWRLDPRTGIAFQLTDNRKYHSSPDWSPDSKWIIYTADDGGKTIQLEILNVETGVTHSLTNDGFIYTDPAFSPDGSQLAYVSTKPNGYFNIYLRPIRDGHWAGEEVAVTRDHSYSRDRLYFGQWDMHLSPAWMPDGKQLLIVSNRNVALGSGNVLRLPALVNGIEQAQTVLAEQTLYRTRPDVSPDGKRFVYSSTRGAADQFNNLFVQPTAGGEPYKLSFFAHDAFEPRWSPDGEWIAYISNEGGLPQLALLETYGGEQRTIYVKDRRWKRSMGLLSVRTVEAETGELTASRIHLTASDGKFYAPADAYARISSAGDKVFHTTGSFTLAVPPGRLRLEAVKGFEFWPEKAEVEIAAHEVTSATLRLKRLTDMSAKGWYSGSTHVHMNYGGNLHNTLENLMMMSAAEDQDVVNEQIANKDNRVLDYQFFVKGGGPHPLSKPDRLLMVGQEYRPPFWGHVFMFGMKDHLISPFTTGYEGTAIESLYPSNTDMFRKAKAQGATVGYVHAFSGENDPINTGLGGAKGFMVDAALGTTDAVEWSVSGRAGFFPWYAVLNNGLRITAVGGEDSISNLHQSKLVGSVRTYVFTGERGLNADAWFEGLRRGQAFVSTGPLVELTVQGRASGEEVHLPAGGGMLEVIARVRSITSLEKVLLIFNGEVAETIPLSGDRKSADYQKQLRVTRSGWYHLRAEGVPAERYPLDTGYAQAFTNPIWVKVGNQPVRNRAAADYAIKWIDRLQEMAEAWPDWRSQKERDHVFAQFEEARQVYRRLARDAEANGGAR